MTVSTDGQLWFGLKVKGEGPIWGVEGTDEYGGREHTDLFEETDEYYDWEEYLLAKLALADPSIPRPKEGWDWTTLGKVRDYPDKATDEEKAYRKKYDDWSAHRDEAKKEAMDGCSIIAHCHHEYTMYGVTLRTYSNSRGDTTRIDPHAMVGMFCLQVVEKIKRFCTLMDIPFGEGDEDNIGWWLTSYWH